MPSRKGTSAREHREALAYRPSSECLRSHLKSLDMETQSASLSTGKAPGLEAESVASLASSCRLPLIPGPDPPSTLDEHSIWNDSSSGCPERCSAQSMEPLSDDRRGLRSTEVSGTRSKGSLQLATPDASCELPCSNTMDHNRNLALDIDQARCFIGCGIAADFQNRCT